MDLTDAARAMAREFEDLTRWEQDLLSDLGQTRAKLGELRRALDGLIRLLPIATRRELRLKIAKLEMPLRHARHRARQVTDKIAAVHDHLAQAEDTVAASDLQRVLEAQGQPAPGEAHRILSRKIKQGLVERLARGLYRVNPHHPEIASRRLRAARIAARTLPDGAG